MRMEKIIAEYEIPTQELPLIAQKREVALDYQKADGASFPGLNTDDWKNWLTVHPVRMTLRSHGSGATGHVAFYQYGWLGESAIERHSNATYQHIARVAFDANRHIESAQPSSQDGHLSIEYLPNRLRSFVYSFNSERKTQPRSAHVGGTAFLLSPDLGNLAEGMNVLSQRDGAKYSLLNSLVHRVLPHIERVQAPPEDSNTFHLQTQFVSKKPGVAGMRRSVGEQGSGVVNVIGMLYQTLVADMPQVLILEEPNVFLHPRALRDLLAIMAEYGSQHQYFVTTHSSDVLKTLSAATVTLLEHDGATTKVRQESGKDLRSLKSSLIQLGIGLTELHSRDHVLWVEGQTEQAAFPKVLEKFFPEKAQRIAVLPLLATGDFESKRLPPEKVAAIYKRLSESNFLAPPMVGIVLDREWRNRTEISAIESTSDGTLKFLPVKMFEDYLLDRDGLKALLAELRVDATWNDAQIDDEIAKAKSEATKGASGVHAADALKSVVWELSNKTWEYKKVEHGLIIVEWLLSNKPEALFGLRDFLAEFLYNESSPSGS